MTRDQLLQSVSVTIRDYRHGEIPALTPEHVERWLRQFEPAVQEPLLSEMDHVLKQSYLSREHFLTFLRGLAGRNQLIETLWGRVRSVLAALLGLGRRGRVRHNGCPAYWRNVRLLEIQRHGDSQRQMVRLLKETLGELPELDARSRGGCTGPFLYLDDILFTGNRVIIDLRDWIEAKAPRSADLVIAVIGCYRRGLVYTHKTILRTAAAVGKSIRVHWLKAVEFEDRPWSAGTRDGFHPTHLPDDPLARAYAEELAVIGFYPRLRVPGVGRSSRLFSSEAGRQLLEQQFLLAGLKIRSFHRNPQAVLRPLGYHAFKDLGFGATIVTYRNCPNNCPLAWWWDTAAVPASRCRGEWHPLFPRKV